MRMLFLYALIVTPMPAITILSTQEEQNIPSRGSGILSDPGRGRGSRRAPQVPLSRIPGIDERDLQIVKVARISGG